MQKALDPFKEDKWDWYQIGGRWTGTLDGFVETVNGDAWPTEWAPHAGDVQPLANVMNTLMTIAVVVAEDISGMGMPPSMFPCLRLSCRSTGSSTVRNLTQTKPVRPRRQAITNARSDA